MSSDSDTEVPVATGLLSDAGLLDRLVTDKFSGSGQQFTPFDEAFKNVVTEESILKELNLTRDQLESDENEKNRKLVDFVQQEAKLVFLTIVWIDHFTPQVKKIIMKRFLKFGFDDSDRCLPVGRTFDREIDIDAFSLRCWSDIRKSDFFTHQWRSLAPVFRKSKFIYELDELCVLPFPRSGQSPPEDGGYSKVWEVGVHEDHIEDPPPNTARIEVVVNAKKNIKCQTITVAMKEFIPAGGMKMEHFVAGWNREVTALQKIKDLDHPNLIRWIAAIQKGPKHFLMFEWADGGNLRSFWVRHDPSKLNINDMRDMVRQTLVQWKGLAECLSKLHMEQKFRHGDIKPENILRFTGAGTLGTLKIADFGLARRYDMETGRRGATMTKATTIEYESPETLGAVVANKGLSRLTDLWSMGCVLLEYIIWLLYGYKEVDRLYRELQGTAQNKRPLYEHAGSSGKTQVRGRVKIWLDHMQRDERCTDTAIGRLLRFVRSNLLVTPPRSNWRDVLRNGQAVADAPPNTRASAPEFYREMTEILKRSDDPAYLFKGFPQPPPPQRAGTTRFDSRPAEANDYLGAGLMGRNLRDTAPQVSGQEVQQEELVVINRRFEFKNYTDHMDKNWAINEDNDFSRGVVNTVRNDLQMAHFEQSLPPPATLCLECEKWDFSKMGSIFDRDMSHLRNRSASCALCKLLLAACELHGLGDVPSLSFDQQDSTLRVGGISKPLVSLVCTPERVSERLRTGFPVLPQSGSEGHFEIVRQWLRSCDTDHSGCRLRGKPDLPTRLIDVGQADVGTIRIVEREEVENLLDHRYIALSHPWGPRPHFCSWSDEYAKNPPADNLAAADNSISKHKQGIRDEALPATFRDAVSTTRALRVPYLWIDSLCHVQDKISSAELLQMESIYNSAYCVLAASWATNQGSGFLKTSAAHAAEKAAGRKREVVTVQPEGSEHPVYVCEAVDDFEAHVINGDLNKRGWILQERALARRTVFFTKHQTYWECGQGVRCETMTHVKNPLAEPMGDPFFPQVMLRGTYGQQLRWYQELYMEYSRRGLSKDYDRGRAIQGLEKRLIGKFGSEGGHGVFYNGRKGGLLQRGLLWRRGDDTPSLKRIHFPADKGYESLPSWSWMAHEGGIDYVKIVGRKSDWEAAEFASPWNLKSDDDDDDDWNESDDNDLAGYDSDDTEQGADEVVVPEDNDDDDGNGPMDDPATLEQNGGTLTLGDLLQGDKDTVLTGVARDFTPDIKTLDIASGIVYYDGGDETTYDEEFKCVVLGREKGRSSARNKTHYVLVVKLAEALWLEPLASGIGESNKCEIYRRVGVGMVPGRCIKFEKQMVERIVKII